MLEQTRDLPLDHLPTPFFLYKDILIHIFSYLGLDELMALQRTCWAFKNAIASSQKLLCKLEHEKNLRVPFLARLQDDAFLLYQNFDYADTSEQQLNNLKLFFDKFILIDTTVASLYEANRLAVINLIFHFPLSAIEILLDLHSRIKNDDDKFSVNPCLKKYSYDDLCMAKGILISYHEVSAIQQRLALTQDQAGTDILETNELKWLRLFYGQTLIDIKNIAIRLIFLAVAFGKVQQTRFLLDYLKSSNDKLSLNDLLIGGERAAEAERGEDNVIEYFTLWHMAARFGRDNILELFIQKGYKPTTKFKPQQVLNLHLTEKYQLKPAVSWRSLATAFCNLSLLKTLDENDENFSDPIELNETKKILRLLRVAGKDEYLSLKKLGILIEAIYALPLFRALQNPNKDIGRYYLQYSIIRFRNEPIALVQLLCAALAGNAQFIQEILTKNPATIKFDKKIPYLCLTIAASGGNSAAFGTLLHYFNLRNLQISLEKALAYIHAAGNVGALQAMYRHFATLKSATTSKPDFIKLNFIPKQLVPGAALATTAFFINSGYKVQMDLESAWIHVLRDLVLLQDIDAFQKFMQIIPGFAKNLSIYLERKDAQEEFFPFRFGSELIFNKVLLAIALYDTFIVKDIINEIFTARWYAQEFIAELLAQPKILSDFLNALSKINLLTRFSAQNFLSKLLQKAIESGQLETTKKLIPFFEYSNAFYYATAEHPLLLAVLEKQGAIVQHVLSLPPFLKEYFYQLIDATQLNRKFFSRDLSLSTLDILYPLRPILQKIDQLNRAIYEKNRRLAEEAFVALEQNYSLLFEFYKNNLSKLKENPFFGNEIKWLESHVAESNLDWPMLDLLLKHGIKLSISPLSLRILDSIHNAAIDAMNYCLMNARIEAIDPEVLPCCLKTAIAKHNSRMVYNLINWAFGENLAYDLLPKNPEQDQPLSIAIKTYLQANSVDPNQEDKLANQKILHEVLSLYIRLASGNESGIHQQVSKTADAFIELLQQYMPDKLIEWLEPNMASLQKALQTQDMIVITEALTTVDKISCSKAVIIAEPEMEKSVADVDAVEQNDEDVAKYNEQLAKISFDNVEVPIINLNHELSHEAKEKISLKSWIQQKHEADLRTLYQKYDKKFIEYQTFRDKRWIYKLKDYFSDDKVKRINFITELKSIMQSKAMKCKESEKQGAVQTEDPRITSMEEEVANKISAGRARYSEPGFFSHPENNLANILSHFEDERRDLEEKLGNYSLESISVDHYKVKYAEKSSNEKVTVDYISPRFSLR